MEIYLCDTLGASACDMYNYAISYSKNLAWIQNIDISLGRTDVENFKHHLLDFLLLLNGLFFVPAAPHEMRVRSCQNFGGLRRGELLLRFVAL